MAKDNKKQEEVLVDVQGSYTKAERFFEENGKTLTGVLIGIFVVVGVYFAYTIYYQNPRELEAQEEIYYAESLFAKDSLQASIDGVNGHLGFLDVAADYSGTKAGNMANYYAGIAYLQLGQFENAIKLLDEFTTNDPILAVEATGAIGDAFLELDQADEALSYYKKAAQTSANNLVVPFYLLKAGLVAEMQGDYSAAVDFYTRIKKDYPKSKQGADIDKYIAYATAKK
jgi:tetratricopeptide (TPR) repeat protein